MILETIELVEQPARPDIFVEGDDDADSEDLVIRVVDGWLNCQIHMSPRRLAELRDVIAEAFGRIGYCEHGIDKDSICVECDHVPMYEV